MNDLQLKEIADKIKSVSEFVRHIEQKAKSEREILKERIQSNKRFVDENLIKKYAEIGKSLIEAKQIIKSNSGHFIKWVKANCPFGKASAQRYIMLFKHIDAGGVLPKMSLMSFVETRTATQEQKEKIDELAEKNGYVTLKDVKEIKNPSAAIAFGRKTNFNLASKRIEHVLKAIERSNFDKKELLNIKDEITEAVTFIDSLLVKINKESSNSGESNA